MTSRSSGAATSSVRAGASTRTRRYAHLPGDGRPRTRLLPPQRRHVLRRRSARAGRSRCPTGRTWRNMVTPAEVQGRRDARRVPRPVRLQPARREPARVRGARCPRSTSGTTTRSSTTGTRARSSPTPATPRSAWTCSRRARTRRSRVAADDPAGAPRRTVSTASSPTGRCSTCSSSTCAPTRTPTTRTSTPTRAAASSAPSSRVAQATGSRHSQATWKVIAIDLPLGLVVPDGDAPRRASPTGPRRAARPRAARSRSCCATRRPAA